MTDAGVDVLSLQQDCTKTVIEAAERAEVWVTGFHYDASAAAPNYVDHRRNLELGPHHGAGHPRDSHRRLPELGQARGHRGRLGQAGPLRRRSVPEETQQLVLDTVEGLRDGSIQPFTGPIYDQDGEVRIPEGEIATDEYLQGVDWLVQGIVGRTN